jgi:tryptophanyl-tRNA synthetase
MRVFSGIQPTGQKHLGNFVGAIRQYVEAQRRAAEAGHEAIFCIVDLHAITVSYDPQELRERVYDTTAILLAAGLDPASCVLFRQGDVPAHTELSWLLHSVTAYGDLTRQTQFKDKAGAQRELVSAGLFSYPVLMAADVLAYRAKDVPVGADQRQHVELMRDVAQRFNARFAGGEEVLVVPEHRIPAVGARIMDLQEPTRKMSTTGGTPEGTVYVLDEPKAIEKKFKRAVTDSDDPPRIAHDREAKPGVSNLLELLAVARGTSIDEAVTAMAGARGYGDLKAATAEAVTELLRPTREAYAELRADEAALEATLAAGAEKAQELAGGTVAEVRRLMGVGPNVRATA